MLTSLVFIACIVHLLFAGCSQAVQFPAHYDTIWTTQSNNSAGSMPLGGGDVGLNAWAESGNILFYIAKSGAFDENNSLLKLGRVRLSMTPNPFALESTFKQQLHMNDGYVTFQGNGSALIKLWVDIETSGIHVEFTSNNDVNLTASFETWREQGRQMVVNEQEGTSWGNGYTSHIPLPYQYPDTIYFASEGVLSYHHNNDTPLFNYQINDQDLSSADPESFYNPMKNNTFGTFMFSPQLQPGDRGSGTYQDTAYTSFNLVSNESSRSFQIYIGTAQDQTTDVESWVKSLVQDSLRMPRSTQGHSMNWWDSFWGRSYIIINPDADPSDAGFQVGKNYQYFRYMMACNAKGKFPTRFNGGLFTFDPYYVSSGRPFSPDYRRWSGGTFVAQNQRLLYWPLLKMGDYDIMAQQFDFYKNISLNSRRLGKFYFGLDVCLTSEEMDNTGLPNVYEYKFNEYAYGQQRTDFPLFPPGIDFNNYVSWLQDTANEFVDMILQARLFNGLDISPWAPFVEYQLAWFDEFYRKRNGLDENGKLIIYPGSGGETYKMALNTASTVSGLRKLISDLLSLDLKWDKGNATYYEEYLARVPATPFQACPGSPSLMCIAPAVNYSSTMNDEPIAMWTVFPWGEYGLGQPTNLTLAMNAYFNDTQSAPYHGTYGWHQDQIWYARMGLTDLAAANTISRFSDSTQYRFSAFKGPNYDWSPDINHYGSAAIGLQEMLLQTFARNNTQIRLLPAWPSNWTGSFKLKAPFATTLTGDISGTAVKNLIVDPFYRRRDIVYGST